MRRGPELPVRLGMSESGMTCTRSPAQVATCVYALPPKVWERGQAALQAYRDAGRLYWQPVTAAVC